jgi:hypothetical protein
MRRRDPDLSLDSLEGRVNCHPCGQATRWKVSTLSASPRVGSSRRSCSVAPKPRAFRGNVVINAATAKMRLVEVVEEIIAVLAANSNADVKVTLDGFIVRSSWSISTWFWPCPCGRRRSNTETRPLLHLCSVAESQPEGRRQTGHASLPLALLLHNLD